MVAPVKLNEVGECAIEREHAAGEHAAGGGAAVFDLHGKSAELIFAVGHAGGGHGVGDEDGAVGALALPPEADDFRLRVNAVADQFGVEVVVGEDSAEDSGLAMIEWSHGIECVRGADGAGGDGGPGFGGGGIRMA